MSHKLSCKPTTFKTHFFSCCKAHIKTALITSYLLLPSYEVRELATCVRPSLKKQKLSKKNEVRELATYVRPSLKKAEII